MSDSSRSKAQYTDEQIEQYRERGRELEAYMSAIDNEVAKHTNPNFDPRYPVSEFDVDFNPRGVYQRVRALIEKLQADANLKGKSTS